MCDPWRVLTAHNLIHFLKRFVITKQSDSPPCKQLWGDSGSGSIEAAIEVYIQDCVEDLMFCFRISLTLEKSFGFFQRSLHSWRLLYHRVPATEGIMIIRLTNLESWLDSLWVTRMLNCRFNLLHFRMKVICDGWWLYVMWRTYDIHTTHCVHCFYRDSQFPV